jgi:hypothetical protein
LTKIFGLVNVARVTQNEACGLCNFEEQCSESKVFRLREGQRCSYRYSVTFFGSKSSRLRAKTHFGVQARNRWPLNETGFITVIIT